MTTNANFSALVQGFFTDRLLRQRRASPHTLAGYRDTFRLLLQFAAGRLGKVPSRLTLEELDAAFIGDFLDHLEKERRNSARSRNTRLAAIHAFFHYVSFQEPAHGEQCRRVLAIPTKRYERRLIEHLGKEEIDALVAAPDKTTWRGRRDHALLLVAIQTGLRVSELIGLQRQDVVLGPLTGRTWTCRRGSCGFAGRSSVSPGWSRSRNPPGKSSPSTHTSGTVLSLGLPVRPSSSPSAAAG